MLSTATEDFLLMKEIEEGRSAATIRAYRHDLSLFRREIGDVDVTTVRTVHVRKFLKALHAREYTRRGLARKIACLRSFFKFLAENRAIREDPMRTVKTPRLRSHARLPKVLAPDEVDLVFATLADPRAFPEKCRVRLELVVHVLYAAMIRVSELVQIRVGDVDFERGVIRVLGKGNKERLVPVDPATLALIREHLWLELGLLDDTPGRKEAYLFPSPHGGHLSTRTIQQDLQRLREHLPRLEGKILTPHTFRHTGATHLRRNGMDLSELQDVLGHSSPNTTRIYARNDITVLRASYMEKHPLARRAREHMVSQERVGGEKNNGD